MTYIEYAYTLTNTGDVFNTLIGGIVVLAIFGAIFGIAFYLIEKGLGPFFKSNEYVQYYKIGRIKQFAKEHDIDIDQTIAYEEYRAKKRKDYLRTWEEKFEAELSKDLDPINSFETEFGESKEKKK